MKCNELFGSIVLVCWLEISEFRGTLNSSVWTVLGTFTRHYDYTFCEQDGLEVMLSVPKKANDCMHLSLLEGCDVPTDSLGEVVLQDSFQVWDLRQIIKKGRERRVFLFDLHLLLAKEVKDSHGKAKYIYKTKFMVS